MALATPLRKVASKLMARFGGVVTIRRVSAGVYNPETGTVTETATDTVARGVLEDVSLREVTDLVQSGDKRLTIAAADVTVAPTTADEVVILGVFALGGRLVRMPRHIKGHHLATTGGRMHHR